VALARDRTPWGLAAALAAGAALAGASGTVALACLDCAADLHVDVGARPAGERMDGEVWLARQELREPRARPGGGERWGLLSLLVAPAVALSAAAAGMLEPHAHLEQRRELIKFAREMNGAGINQGTSGNLSVRVPGGFLITPSGMPYDTMQPEDVVFMDLGGGYWGKYKPSSEWRMHYDIYCEMPQVNAVLHAHPTYCTAVAAQRRPIPAFHYMVGVANGKQIPCAPYLTFGTQARPPLPPRAWTPEPP
jgi:hypothetical protein